MRKTSRRKRGIQWGLDTMEELDFADNLALLSTSRRNLQQKTNELEVHAKRTGLHINTAKTKVMKTKTDDNQPIVIGIDDVETADISARLTKARAAYYKLRKVWASGQYRRKTKLRIYKSNVISVVLYGAECWKVNQNDDLYLDCRLMVTFWLCYTFGDIRRFRPAAFERNRYTTTAANSTFSKYLDG